jgi:ATP/maltotriose-dependent transcriptional regulator MalT
LYAFALADWSEGELEVLDDQRPKALFEPLTPREREILQLVAEGLPGPGVAEHLTVGPATVKTHLSDIYAKLGVAGRADAVARGMRLRLIN